jgi:hypothetical protein
MEKLGMYSCSINLVRLMNMWCSRKLLSQEVKTSIYLNGVVSKSFKINRGLGTLTPYLFLIVRELFNIMFKQETIIWGKDKALRCMTL